MGEDVGYEERKNVGDERHLGRYALIIFDIAKVLNYFEKDEELSWNSEEKKFLLNGVECFFFFFFLEYEIIDFVKILREN